MGRVRRVLRWIRRVVVGAVAFAVLAIAVVLIALHTDWGREQVRKRAEAALAESFPGGARIGRVEGSVLGALVLRDIVLRDAEQQPTITIDRLTLDVGYRALLRGELALESLALDGVTVRVRMPAGGGAPNVATLYRPNPEPSTWDVAVRKLVVRGATIELDRGDGTIEHLDGVELTAALSMRAVGTLAARGELRATWRERAAPLVASAEVAVDAAGVVQVARADAALADVALVVRDLRIAGPDVAGTLEVRAPEGALARLAAMPTLPSPMTAVTVTAAPGTDGAIAVRLGGSVAGAGLDGTLAVYAQAKEPRVAGSIDVTKLDLAAMLPTLPPSGLSVKLAVDAAYDATARGLAAVQGHVELTGGGTVAAVALADLRARAEIADGQATLSLTGSGPGGTVLDARARVTTTAEGYQLEDGTLTAAIASLATATDGRSPVDGAVDLKVNANGALAGDHASLAIAGTVEARRIRGPGQVRVGLVTARFAVTGAPAAPRGEVDVVATRVAVGTQRVSRVHAQAQGGLDGPIAVEVDASDRARGLTGAVAAAVTRPTARDATTFVALGSYRLGTRLATLSGRGGSVTIDETRVAVRRIQLRGGGGTIALDGELGRGARASDRSGTVAVTGVDLATLRGVPGVPPAARGTVDVRGRFTQRGAALTGALTLDGRGLALAPGAGTVEVSLAVDAGPRALTVTLDGRGASVGAVAVALAVTPPRRLDDLAAWQRLDRGAVQTLTVESERLDLAAVAALAGVRSPVAGSLTISTADGLVIVGRGLTGPNAPAPLDLDVTITAPPNAPLALRARASLGALGAADVTARLRLPPRPLSPASWRALGPAAIDGATLSVPDVTIDHALARALGLGAVRGRVAISATATAGLRGLDVRVDGRELVMAPGAAPATAVATVHADDGGVDLGVEVGLAGAPMLSVAARSPTPLPRLLAVRAPLASLPMTGTVTIVEREVAALAQALGQPTRITGRVRGEATLSGTIGAPIATAALVVSDLGVRERGRGGIRQLDVALDYRGGVARAEVRGRQDDGGSLDLVAEYELGRGTAPKGTVRARSFQIAPIARLVPTTLLGVRGVLDADLQLRGGTPRDALITGVVRVTGAQAPLSDVIGNLRDGALTVTFSPGAAKVELAGNVESGRLDARASAVLDGVVPRTATVDVGVRELTLITSKAPRLAGDLHVDLDLRGAQWVATARVRDGVVNVPAKGGRVLHPAGAPPDLVFTDDTSVDARIPVTRATLLRTWLGTRPTVPLLALSLTIEPVSVVSPQLRGEVSGKLDLSIGVDGAAVDGRIAVDSGTVVVLERRYSIRRAELVFDGSIDPLLGIELEYQFPDLALRVGIDGRLSQPRLVLTSTPGTYTEGQLLAMLLGGSPTTPGGETFDAAAGVVSSVASAAIGGVVQDALPFRLDVLYYEPATATSGGAVVGGRWVTSKLLVLGRRRVDPAADQNASEAELRYWLARRVLLEAIGGDRGAFGLNLVWNRRW